MGGSSYYARRPILRWPATYLGLKETAGAADTWKSVMRQKKKFYIG